MTNLTTSGGGSPDDGAVGRGLRAGDEAAFTALYERYAQRIHDYTQRLTGNPSAAEDLTQMTFLQAWQRRGDLREGAAVRGWLYRIAHNLAVNQATRTRTTGALDDLEVAATGPAPDQLVIADEVRELVWDAAASLQANQYAFLDLSLRQGLSTTEVGEVLGMSTAKASLGVNRAREALGNAVRYLLVARRRHHCPRLAELVPSGVRRLTAEERVSVDHHMRRCEDCERTARLLTAPDELFGGIALLPLPPALLRPPPVTAGPQAPGGARRLTGRRLLRNPAVVVGATAALVAASVATGVVLTRSSPSTTAIGPGPIASSGPTTAALPSRAAPGNVAQLATSGFSPVAVPGVAGAGTTAFLDATCPSATRCYVVGGGTTGTVAVTTDGARTWSSSTVTGTTLLSAIACPTPTRCWATGTADNGDAIVVLTTSGDTWTPAFSGPGLLLSSIACPTTAGCIAVGANLARNLRDVVATTDGGKTWSVRSLPDPTASLLAVRCHDATHCIAVGTGAWSTATLGASWSDVSPPRQPSTGPQSGFSLGFVLADVTYAATSDVWVVGGAQCGGQGVTQCPAFTFHSTNGGRTWTPYEKAAQTFAFAWQIHCQASACILIGQAFSTSSILVTTDGTSWRVVQSAGGQLNALACAGGTVCIVAGGSPTGPDILVVRQP